MPIPGTTKAAHLQENLAAADLNISKEEFSQLNSDISKIKIVGDRYTEVEKSRVGQ